MPVADKILALLDNLTPADIDALSPVMRQRFAQTCQHWGRMADRSPCAAIHAEGEATRWRKTAKSGIIAELRELGPYE